MSDTRYKAKAVLDFSRTFKTRVGAERYLEKLEAKLAAANAICDGKIWTNIELMYLCRWDCPTPRVAPAFL